MLNTRISLWVNDLPIDAKHVFREKGLIAHHHFSLPPSMINKMKTLSDNIPFDLPLICFSSFLLLLYRLTDQHTIQGGYPAPHKESENDASPFSIGFNRKRSFMDFMSNVHKNIAKENSLPSPLALSGATKEHEDSLFKLSFEFSNSTETRRPDNGTHPAEWLSDLSLRILEIPNQTDVTISFNREMLKLSTIERWGAYFTKILNCILSDPQAPVNTLSILSDKEKNQLLYEFNPSAVDTKIQQTIHEIFQNQAQKTPEYTALEYHDRKMTYGELDEKSNQVARILKKRGIMPDSIVGVFLERSMEMIYGILGILKAGGAYLPVSPTFPGERIKYLLEDSGAEIVLTQKNLKDRISFFNDILLIGDNEISGADVSPLEKIGTPDNLSYVIYTSGSTGAPKAVMQRHKTVVASFSTLAKAYPMKRDDAFLFRTIFTFDPSVAELFFWFFGCGKAVIADDGDEKQPDKIVEHIYNHKVTHLVAVPSLLNAFMESLDPSSNEKLNSLKYVFVLGEAVTPALVKNFYSHFKTAAMENIYGPTETLLATHCHIPPSLMDADIIPVGKPISSVRIYIMNTHMELQPIGVPGEIYIGGDNVAKGYLHQEEMTRERFLKDPFRPEKRMYRSGDLGRWLEDGNIDFIGRMDFQVKVSGVRIELGEIENQLLRLEPVKETAVLALQDKQTGDKFLCAYLVLHDNEFDIVNLKQKLLENIPSYMVPSYFVKLAEIPLTSNGKLDRRALPWPTVADLHVDYQPPRNDMEKKLVAVWQELLDVKAIGITHNFFDLGGNSLKAIRLVSRLKTHYRISINDIFNSPTIQGLSEKISPKSETLSDRIKVLSNDRKESTLAPTDLIRQNPDLQKTYNDYISKIKNDKTLDLTGKTDYRHIFLTGSTGYLGAYLLREILDKTSAHVYLPIRGKNKAEASDRLKRKILFYFGSNFHEQNKNRFTIVRGNLPHPRLGMEKDEYEALSGKIDCIINSAANVKHYGHYPQFHDINVEAVKRLIEFAQSGHEKHIHQLSTIGVSIGTVEDRELILFTENDYDVDQCIENHYINTKLDAEKCILNARKQGVSANIYRIGDIVFDSSNGKFQENIDDNAFYSIIRSYIRIERIPQTETHHDFAFVDFVSRAITLLFNRSQLCNETFHIFNHRKTDLARRLVNGPYGLKLQETDFKAFLEYLDRNRDEPGISEYVQDILLHYGLLDDEVKTRAIVRGEKTDQILAMLGFQWPGLSDTQIGKMIDHCRRVGFI